jgi:hypothetical protein
LSNKNTLIGVSLLSDDAGHYKGRVVELVETDFRDAITDVIEAMHELHGRQHGLQTNREGGPRDLVGRSDGFCR